MFTYNEYTSLYYCRNANDIMGMTNPKILIPLIWLGCTAAYFVAAFWLPRPDFAVQEAPVSGILEIWLHEIMRGAPVLIPGFGVLWGVFSSMGFAQSVFFMSDHSMFAMGPQFMFVVFPFLSLYMLAQCIMIRRGILILMALRQPAETRVAYHESEQTAEWSESNGGYDISVLRDKLAPMAKPFLRDTGIFFALLFVSAILTFVAWGDVPSSTTLQAHWTYDGMLEYWLSLPDRIGEFVPDIDWDAMVSTVWESLT